MVYQSQYSGTQLDTSTKKGKEDVYWDDLKFPASGINPAGLPSPPTVDTSDPFAGTLLFSESTINVIAGQAQLPHGWYEGSEIRPHIHWCPTNTDTGNVYWRLEYQISNVNGTFPASYTTINILDAGDGTNNKHQIAPFGAIDMTGYNLSCMILWKISRIGGDGTDTYNTNARFLEFDIHYQRDRDGSEQEYIKEN